MLTRSTRAIQGCAANALATRIVSSVSKSDRGTVEAGLAHHFALMSLGSRAALRLISMLRRVDLVLLAGEYVRRVPLNNQHAVGTGDRAATTITRRRAASARPTRISGRREAALARGGSSCHPGFDAHVAPPSGEASRTSMVAQGGQSIPRSGGQRRKAASVIPGIVLTSSTHDVSLVTDHHVDPHQPAACPGPGGAHRRVQQLDTRASGQLESKRYSVSELAYLAS